MRERILREFSIEVRPRSGDHSFVARFTVDAVTERAAIEEATRRFRHSNPGKNVDDYTFKAVGI